ncbi:hypothetical protein SOM11_05795 [Frigoribacterium sp. CFBP9039]|uniref:hypothetical protein n=1 Tax=Frigoribacterium sp. CFBP9029 TaxID=3096541 RepID=UPI002A6A9BD3|nr:hypothetical protein [Frigoribacterium sp. CFBP9039]MDY0945497.1 hypothetical protein [Frigoribacterium sp. CFBP9039]
MTHSIEWHHPGDSLDRWIIAQIFFYFSTPLTLVLSQGPFALYGIIELFWMSRGRRTELADPADPSSLAWPPFILPGWIFVILTVFVVCTLVLTFVGPKAGPIRAHPWMLPFFWGISAFFLADYSIAFDYAEGWPTYVVYFAAVMGACSVVGFAAAVVRSVRERAERRREQAVEA